MSRGELPAFASEAEEAAWWYDNREQHDAEFVKAFEEGRVRRGSGAQRLAAARQIAMVQLSEQDALTAKALAERKGIETNTLLSELLHAALEREIQQAA